MLAACFLLDCPVVRPDVCPVPTTLAVGQHALCAGESIPVQKVNNPQGGQIHYIDARASNISLVLLMNNSTSNAVLAAHLITSKYYCKHW